MYLLLTPYSGYLLESCRASGAVQTALEAINIVGIVLSLAGIVNYYHLHVTGFEVSWFRSGYSHPKLFSFSVCTCYWPFLDNVSITQETPETKCYHISHPTLYSTILYDDCICVVLTEQVSTEAVCLCLFWSTTSHWLLWRSWGQRLCSCFRSWSSYLVKQPPNSLLPSR